VINNTNKDTIITVCASEWDNLCSCNRSVWKYTTNGWCTLDWWSRRQWVSWCTSWL